MFILHFLFRSEGQWKGNGSPIFLFLGGMESVDEAWNRAGFVHELAVEEGAYTVFLEHVSYCSLSNRITVFITSIVNKITRLYRGRVPRLTSDIFMCCHTEKERGDHDFCLSYRSCFTDINPTRSSRERAQQGGNRTRDLLTSLFC